MSLELKDTPSPLQTDEVGKRSSLESCSHYMAEEQKEDPGLTTGLQYVHKNPSTQLIDQSKMMTFLKVTYCMSTYDVYHIA